MSLAEALHHKVLKMFFFLLLTKLFAQFCKTFMQGTSMSNFIKFGLAINKDTCLFEEILDNGWIMFTTHLNQTVGKMSAKLNKITVFFFCKPLFKEKVQRLITCEKKILT